MARRAFLIVYCLSGAAALLYQVAWSRLLTLYLGHTVAAVGTVLAAFMGGLALGAGVGGRVATTLPRERALVWYARLEAAIAAGAVMLPLGLAAFQPLLRWAYADGTGEWFGIVRVVCSLVLIAVPATAMGATLPLAVRWFVGDAAYAARDAGGLYAVNTIGAAIGAALTGFLLLPALGLRTTILIGVAINLGAAVAAFQLARTVRVAPHHRQSVTAAAQRVKDADVARPWLAAAALAVSGFVALLFEVVWTRALALVLGPTTYAFTAMLLAFIVGIALGSAAASRLSGRFDRRGMLLPTAMVLAAVGAIGASLAIERIPLAMAALASAPDATLSRIAIQQALLVAPILLPMSLAFGAAFPFAVALAARRTEQVAGDVARVYVANTVGAIAGALAGSFLFVPGLGLQRSIAFGAVLLASTGAIVALALPRGIRTGAGVAAGALVVVGAALWLPSWNLGLMSSGAYKYAADAGGGDLIASLEAGELLYYGEGASGTVSVRRVAGTTSLAIDGKVDASDGADMLTQKLLAHLPLMLHPSPREVAVIGLGSGVTVGAALRHPLTRVDALEISPQVVAASSHFRDENHEALADPRTRLIVADGRTHLMLSEQTYDVIISEPSNPWMAGIAALFTQEFFAAARARLRPGGVLCQWAHTYDITDDDLRSIVATFASVFPDGSMWLVGGGDLLLIGADAPVADLLPNLDAAWARPGVAADLATVGVRHVFSLLSLFVAGGQGLREYGRGVIQRDHRLALEFSAPRGIYGGRTTLNIDALRRLAAASPLPAPIDAAMRSAAAPMWRDLGLMHLDAKAPVLAYDALARALALDARDERSLEGLSRAAAASGRQTMARAVVERAARLDPGNVPARVALSRLLAAGGDLDAAIRAVGDALQIDPSHVAAREQLASIFADADDAARLEAVVQAMIRDDPERAGTFYYRAVLHFRRGEFAEAAAMGERAAAADPADGRAHNLLGAAFASLGRRERARAALETATRADPRDPSALTNLGMFELESSNARAAAARFAEALLLDPASAPARDGLALALEQQGESERAARLRGLLH
jgi:spermidine synthase